MELIGQLCSIILRTNKKKKINNYNISLFTKHHHNLQKKSNCGVLVILNLFKMYVHGI